MFAECRRLGIRYPWLYFLGSLLIAISFMFPLFMAQRHRKLIEKADGEPRSPEGSDWVAIAIVVLLAGGTVTFSLSRM
jgi:drug/metabolite transporter (DMT)-like permease